MGNFFRGRNPIYVYNNVNNIVQPPLEVIKKHNDDIIDQINVLKIKHNDVPIFEESFHKNKYLEKKRNILSSDHEEMDTEKDRILKKKKKIDDEFAEKYFFEKITNINKTKMIELQHQKQKQVIKRANIEFNITKIEDCTKDETKDTVQENRETMKILENDLLLHKIKNATREVINEVNNNRNSNDQLLQLQTLIKAAEMAQVQVQVQAQARNCTEHPVVLGNVTTATVPMTQGPEAVVATSMVTVEIAKVTELQSSIKSMEKDIMNAQAREGREREKVVQLQLQISNAESEKTDMINVFNATLSKLFDTKLNAEKEEQAAIVQLEMDLNKNNRSMSRSKSRDKNTNKSKSKSKSNSNSKRFLSTSTTLLKDQMQTKNLENNLKKANHLVLQLQLQEHSEKKKQLAADAVATQKIEELKTELYRMQSLHAAAVTTIAELEAQSLISVTKFNVEKDHVEKLHEQTQAKYRNLILLQEEKEKEIQVLEAAIQKKDQRNEHSLETQALKKTIEESMRISQQQLQTIHNLETQLTNNEENLRKIQEDVIKREAKLIVRSKRTIPYYYY